MEKETNKFHALQLFTDTFTAETVHLTNNKIGIYIRLLSFAWTKNAKPFSTESAYRICQCMSDQCCIDVYEVLEEFFKVDQDNKDRNKKTWFHKRLIQEHEYLSNKYKVRAEAGKKGGLAKRDFATSKIIAPIPIPSPIPNNKYDSSFEQLWEKLDIKRGSKWKAFQLIKKHHSEIPDIEQLSKIYNNQIKGIETQFIPHFSTWLSQKRWEIQENDQKINHLANIIERMKKLGYEHKGQDGNFEKFFKDGKTYKIDKYDEKHMLQLEQ